MNEQGASNSSTSHGHRVIASRRPPSGVLSLFLLLIAPQRAVERLFARSRPELVIFLIVLYTLVPAMITTAMIREKRAPSINFFFLINRLK